MTLPIIGGDYGALKRLGLGGRGTSLELVERLEAVERRLEAMKDGFGTFALYSQFASFGTLTENLSVSSGKTVDGRDVGVDGAQLDNTVSVVGVENRIYLSAAEFDNRDGRTIGYSNERVFIQAIDAATSRYYTTVLIPESFEAGSSIVARVHWLVAGAGGTNGQDIVWRVQWAFTDNNELTSTGGGSADLTVDCPNVTAETAYRTVITSSITGAAAGDLMTFVVHRRGSDAADTLTATAGFAGAEIEFTKDQTP